MYLTLSGSLTASLTHSIKQVHISSIVLGVAGPIRVPGPFIIPSNPSSSSIRAPNITSICETSLPGCLQRVQCFALPGMQYKPQHAEPCVTPWVLGTFRLHVRAPSLHMLYSCQDAKQASLRCLCLVLFSSARNPPAQAQPYIVQQSRPGSGQPSLTAGSTALHHASAVAGTLKAYHRGAHIKMSYFP